MSKDFIERRNSYSPCRICPRECGVDRTIERGFCGSGTEMRVGRIAPHLWEEPFLSGQGIEEPVLGSGTVFFCGCNLGCVYCQNHKISGRNTEKIGIGREYNASELADAFLRLESSGVHNINLVTAAHYLPSVAECISLAKSKGLTVPVVYNSSGYEKAESLRELEGLVDIYLPDIKYFSSKYASDYSFAPDYPEVARAAVEEMYRQTGKPRFDSLGFMISGTAIRHLLLPGCDHDSVKIVEWIKERFGVDGVCLSLMNQYTPVVETEFPELSERISRNAYIRVVERAQKIGIERLYTQEDGTASESFIPDFL